MRIYPPSFSSSTDELVEFAVEMCQEFPERSIMQMLAFPIGLWIVIAMFLIAYIRETLHDAFR